MSVMSCQKKFWIGCTGKKIDSFGFINFLIKYQTIEIISLPALELINAQKHTQDRLFIVCGLINTGKPEVKFVKSLSTAGNWDWAKDYSGQRRRRREGGLCVV